MIDNELEAAIDDAGRLGVFATVWAAGWPVGSAPPKWVWWEAVRMARKSSAAPHDSAKRKELGL